MPSPSQDSETLTDAELQRVKDASAYVGLVMHIPASVVHRLCLEVSRHRTPSVPGEDMRARARALICKVYGQSADDVGTEDADTIAIAALLSSTAALAREEAAKQLRAEQRELDEWIDSLAPTPEDWADGALSAATVSHNRRAHLRPHIAKAVRDAMAAAIRAIGKEEWER